MDEYSHTENPHRRAELAREIWQRHLAEGAPEPVNIDAAARRVTAEGIRQEPPAKNLFEPVILDYFYFLCTKYPPVIFHGKVVAIGSSSSSFFLLAAPF